jgi:hypothetical protein
MISRDGRHGNKFITINPRHQPASAGIRRQGGGVLIDADKPVNLLEHVWPRNPYRHHLSQRYAFVGTSNNGVFLVGSTGAVARRSFFALDLS